MRKSNLPNASSNREAANGEQNKRYPKKCVKFSTNQDTMPAESSLNLNCSQHEVLQYWPKVAFLHPITIGRKYNLILMYIEREDLVNFKDYCSKISSGKPVSHSNYSDLLKSVLEFIEKTTNLYIVKENDTETVFVDEPSESLQINKNESELSDCNDKMLGSNLCTKEILNIAKKKSEVNDLGICSNSLDYSEGKSNILNVTIDINENFVSDEIPIEPPNDPNMSADFGAYVNRDTLSNTKDKHLNENEGIERNDIISNTCQETVNIIGDKFLYCEHCNKEYSGHCPKHETVLVLDNPVPRTVTNRASLSTPYPLQVKESKGPLAGLGVFTTESLPCCLVFGPYQGIFSEITKNRAYSGYRWHIKTPSLKGICVDAVDTSASNWMRYVKCGRDDKEINLAAFQYEGNIYYRTIRNIPRATELMVWYGDDYGKELGLTPVTPKVVNHITSDEISSCPQTFKNNFNSTNCGEKKVQIISEPWGKSQSVPNDNIEDSVKSFENQESETNRVNCDDLNEDKENSAAIKGTKIFKCSSCDYRTNQSGNLKKHLRIHTGDKLKCSYCDYETIWSGNLQRHEKIHTGDKLKCSYCDYETIRSGNMRSHERKHTGDKLKCSYCDHETIWSGNLRSHERKHTGNMLKCTQCNYETSRSDRLKRHEHNKHKYIFYNPLIPSLSPFY